MENWMWIDTAKFILEFLHYTKLFTFALVSFLLSGTIGEIAAFLLLQTATIADNNYTIPILSGLSGLGFYFVTKYFDDWLLRRREEKKDEKAKENQHITFSEKVLELQQKRDGEFIDELKEFCESKLKFKDEDIIKAKTGECYGRERAHAYGSYCQSVVGYAHILETLCRENNISIPIEFTFKSETEIMMGVEEKVLEFEAKLKAEHAAKYRERDGGKGID